MDYKNENYIFIKISNSTRIKPDFQKGLPVTTKEDKEHHGIGTKSVAKIIKKYAGDIKYQYLNNKKEFDTTILIRIN